MTTSPSRRDLLCFSHLRWDFVTQRPQHLLCRAAQDRRVFFWEEPILHGADEAGTGAWLEAMEVAPRITVLRPRLPHGADVDAAQLALLQQWMQAQHIRDYDCWYYTPMARAFTRQLRPVVLVYDCMDELKNFLHAPPQLMRHEQELLSAADVVFTGGNSLYESKRKAHPHVFAMPSSIDKEHFAEAFAPSVQEPADQANLPHPRAGFYGVVDERFDVELLRAVAESRPEVQFVILGPVVKIDPALLPQAANVHYLGGRPYRELPAYLSGWDVALLPFARNDATRFISPTKTPEYLAARRPVVSTPIQDVVSDYGDVVGIAATPQAFAEAIDQALQQPTAEWQQRVVERLRPMSWDNTWRAMQRAMDDAEQRNSTHPAPHAHEHAGGHPDWLPAYQTPLRAAADVRPLPSVEPSAP